MEAFLDKISKQYEILIYKTRNLKNVQTLNIHERALCDFYLQRDKYKARREKYLTIALFNSFIIILAENK